MIQCPFPLYIVQTKYIVVVVVVWIFLFHRKKVAHQMTRLLYKKSDFKVLSSIINNSCAENTVDVCKASAVYKNLFKNLAGWN